MDYIGVKLSHTKVNGYNSQRPQEGGEVALSGSFSNGQDILLFTDASLPFGVLRRGYGAVIFYVSGLVLAALSGFYSGNDSSLAAEARTILEGLRLATKMNLHNISVFQTR